MLLLKCQKPFLCRNTAAIAGHTSAASYNSVTWDNNDDRIFMIGHAYSSARLLVAGQLLQFLYNFVFPVRDCQQCLPYALLKNLSLQASAADQTFFAVLGNKDQLPACFFKQFHTPLICRHCFVIIFISFFCTKFNTGVSPPYPHRFSAVPSAIHNIPYTYYSLHYFTTWPAATTTGIVTIDKRVVDEKISDA